MSGAGAGTWVPRPAFPERAQPLLVEGRTALKGGARAEGMALLRAACALDPGVYCKPWGLMPILKEEGRDKLRQRMLDRLQNWYRAPLSQAHLHVSALTRKERMQAYISDLGLPLPQQYQSAAALSDLVWDSLPERVVIKPENGASSKGVIVAAGGYDHIANAPIGESLSAYAERLYATTFGEASISVLAEEMLRDVAADMDPALVVPRDFKVFAVAGQAVFVRVHDRNAPDGKRALATLDRDGQPLPSAQKDWPEAAPAPVPEGYGALIAMAEHISARLPWLLRLDFYLTPEGPFFGEFTTFPNAGLDYTAFGRRTVLQMWEIWPD